MRYCTNCHRITTGQPLFCNHCGRSYDVKLCPRLHANPRAAELCSQCGSRDLSTPHSQARLWRRSIWHLLRYLPGIVLLLLTVIFALTVLRALIVTPELLSGLFVRIGAWLVLAWLWFVL